MYDFAGETSEEYLSILNSIENGVGGIIKEIASDTKSIIPKAINKHNLHINFFISVLLI